MQSETKEELIKEFLSFLSEPEEIERFSDHEWQKRITIENLNNLIANEKELVSAKNMFLKSLEKKRVNTIMGISDRSIFITGVADLFVDISTSDAKKETFNLIYLMLKEIYDQQGFGKGRYHKYDVPDHTREALSIYRKFDFIPNSINQLLQEEIDGITKDILIQLAIVFHDAGKKSIYDETGSMKNHVRYTVNHQIDTIAKRFGLTNNQK
ncbi:MAG: hypothetical protein HQK98_00835 [Nitrospirae bacterium]|nr:hypothetical protein [Nitrospirota bacterium]